MSILLHFRTKHFNRIGDKHFDGLMVDLDTYAHALLGIYCEQGDGSEIAVARV